MASTRNVKSKSIISAGLNKSLLFCMATFLLILLCNCSHKKVYHDRVPTLYRVEKEPIDVFSKEIPVLFFPRYTWTITEVAYPDEADPMIPITRITIHHDGMPPVKIDTHESIKARIALIRRSHIRKGWADIGYHFIVDPLGRVWEGRPLKYQGAHVEFNNEGNIGILVLGNFQVEHPTKEALDGLFKFVAYLMEKYQIHAHNVFTHCELAFGQYIECPGYYLQEKIDLARRPGGLLSH